LDLHANADSHHVLAGKPGERVGGFGVAPAARYDNTRAISLAFFLPVPESVICATIKTARIDEGGVWKLLTK
jgi:hypothetical protein